MLDLFTHASQDWPALVQQHMLQPKGGLAQSPQDKAAEDYTMQHQHIQVVDPGRTHAGGR